MRAPASIRKAETPETIAISARAHAALRDDTLTDAAADGIITDCNRALDAAGMPSGAHIISRAQWRMV